jgi:hypothetical protein
LWRWLQPAYKVVIDDDEELLDDAFAGTVQQVANVPVTVTWPEDERSAPEVRVDLPALLLPERARHVQTLLATTKIRYIVARLLEPGKKSLVVSSFWQALVTLERCLELLGAPYRSVRARDRRSHDARHAAVQEFQQDESVNALLLSVDQNALCFDLSCASRVFFVEPLLDPEAEQQVLARVHRVGQAQAVHVETLVLEDTVERALLQQRAELTPHDGAAVPPAALPEAPPAAQSRGTNARASGDAKRRKLDGEAASPRGARRAAAESNRPQPRAAAVLRSLRLMR